MRYVIGFLIFMVAPAQAADCFDSEQFWQHVRSNGFSLLGAGEMPGGHKEGQLWVDRDFQWMISRAGDDGQTCVMWRGKNWKWAPLSSAHEVPS